MFLFSLLVDAVSNVFTFGIIFIGIWILNELGFLTWAFAIKAFLICFGIGCAIGLFVILTSCLDSDSKK